MPKYLDYHGLETLTNDIDATYMKKNQRGVANGVASLDSNGKVPTSQIPGGAGGTTDYDDLTDKPQINGTTLSGNKTTANLGIHEVPSGGTTGQVLAKASGSDHDVQWVNQSGGGGTTDYDDLSDKPQINGTTLSGNKTTENLGIHEVPSGGTTGQVLTKSSGTDHDVEWTTPAEPTPTDEIVVVSDTTPTDPDARIWFPETAPQSVELPTYAELQAVADSITPDYEDLTYPVAAGQGCMHGGTRYTAKQNIQSAELWTAAHWEETPVEDELWSLKTEITQTADDLDSVTEPYGHEYEWVPVQISTAMAVANKRTNEASGSRVTKDPSVSTSGLTNSTVTSCVINAFTCEANKKYRLTVINGATPANIGQRAGIVIAQDYSEKLNNIVETFYTTNSASNKDYFEFTPNHAGYVYFNIDANYQGISVDFEKEIVVSKTAVDNPAREAISNISKYLLNNETIPELEFESGSFDISLEDVSGSGYRSQIITGVKDCAVCIKVNPTFTAMYGNGTDELVTIHGSFVYHSTKDTIRIWVSDTVANSGLEVRIYKEKGHRGEYDVIVAASNSSAADKEIADIVCDGVNDEIDLQFAVNWNFGRKLAGSKRDATNVLLLPGNYTIDEFSVKETLYGVETVAQYAVMVGNDSFTSSTSYFYSASIRGTSEQGHLGSGAISRINVSDSALSTLSNEKENVLIGVCRAGSRTGGGIHMNGLCIEVKNLSIYTNGSDNKIIALDGYTAGGSVFENNDIWSVLSTSAWNPTIISQIPEGSIGIRAGDGSCYGVRQLIRGNRIQGYHEGISLTGEHFIVQDNLEIRCYYGFATNLYPHNGANQHPNVFIGNSVEQCYCLGKLGTYTSKQTLVYIGGSVENIIGDGTAQSNVPMLPIEVSNDSKYRGRIESDSLASPYNESMFESGKGSNFEQTIYPYTQA